MQDVPTFFHVPANISALMVQLNDDAYNQADGNYSRAERLLAEAIRESPHRAELNSLLNYYGRMHTLRMVRSGDNRVLKGPDAVLPEAAPVPVACPQPTPAAPLAVSPAQRPSQIYSAVAAQEVMLCVQTLFDLRRVDNGMKLGDVTLGYVKHLEAVYRNRALGNFRNRNFYRGIVRIASAKGIDDDNVTVSAALTVQEINDLNTRVYS